MQSKPFSFHNQYLVLLQNKRLFFNIFTINSTLKFPFLLKVLVGIFFMIIGALDIDDPGNEIIFLELELPMDFLF